MSAISSQTFCRILCCCPQSDEQNPSSRQAHLLGPHSHSMDEQPIGPDPHSMNKRSSRGTSQLNTAAKVHANAAIYPYHIGRAINHPAIL